MSQPVRKPPQTDPQRFPFYRDGQRRGRPASALIGYLSEGFLRRLHMLRAHNGIALSDWSRVVEIAESSISKILNGRAHATHTNLAAVARMAAVVGVPADWVTAYELPRVPVEITLADLDRVEQLGAKSPFVKQLVEARRKALGER